MAEITVTLKGGPGYEAPWIVVKADSVNEISSILGELASVGAFEATQTLAHEFRNAKVVTSEAAVATIQDAIPGSEVVREEARPTSAQAASSPTPATTQPAVPATPSSTSVQQSTPPCETCGGATTYRSGNHPTNGPWEAYFCNTGDRSHTRFLGR